MSVAQGMLLVLETLVLLLQDLVSLGQSGHLVSLPLVVLESLLCMLLFQVGNLGIEFCRVAVALLSEGCHLFALDLFDGESRGLELSCQLEDQAILLRHLLQYSLADLLALDLGSFS